MNTKPVLFSLVGVATALLAAALACSPLGSGPDTAATVTALSELIDQTLQAAQTPVDLTTPAIPTVTQAPPTAQPTLGLPQPTVAPSDSGPEPTHPPATALPGQGRPNGLPYHAGYAGTAPTIDGQLTDWSTLPGLLVLATYKPDNWKGLNDCSVAFGIQWDTTYLYLAAKVTDDVHVQTQHKEYIYKGDSLEILLDTDLKGDFSITTLSPDDFQLGLSPGALSGDTPEAYLWFPTEYTRALTEVKVAAQPDGSSYRLEAAIPWSVLKVTPAAGTAYGFALSASDNDTPGTAAQETLITTTAARKLTNPTTWGTLILDQ